MTITRSISRLNRFSTKKEGWNAKIASQKSIILVVEIHKEIVGFITGGVSRQKSEFDGEIIAFYIYPTYQGKGIGKNLFHAMVHEFIRLKYDSFYLWVLSNNPSRKFYEKMGGVYEDMKKESLGNTKVIEVSYGWKNIKIQGEKSQ